ncbi:heavy metal translocating P-type ATPase [Mycobacterium intracellulare]|uniref:Heavy metal translocating P-type ATPase n=1 Tax=Mycobacterium intracellulare subsp. chimaera TaxID=222805 RepID=A0A7U5MKB8_MYCIT|nr:heavy metal translocating P-type ATPase [Mycobacterium intracellulare]ASL15134.1 metal cation transporter p-type ATPase [Mycobacterium intracellulare subsp. chimaera]ASQ86323.1 cadmium-translocating P-type ATPase [Mycobacterium intracellulare subsp. chimaera]MCF1811661.1 cadmium-translocating P-type ATPase [Mycobacterium intracellulare subsp. intracellulare]MDM3926252.1 heavy metal translocating P-type ATPase [Mycobacterium intracellulare subsp. chimaera]MDS0333228.1 cadmium-translocating P
MGFGTSGHSIAQVRPLVEPVLVAATVGALAAGGIAWLGGWRGAADDCWIVATALAIAPATVWVALQLRRRRGGVDLIALVSLVGCLLVDEYLAGALIAVMLTGGRALDAAAERRASHDLRALLQRAPRFARRRVGTQVSVIPLGAVAVGDVLVVGPGEVVPVDGRVSDVTAVLDESVLTGEPLQIERGVGEPVRSGVINAGGAFELGATATAAESTYAGIVQLAQQAAAESAPIVRLADRYAVWFLPLALLLAGIGWLVSGSAVRAVAVLVVATPCPLLLAAPVAIVSGLSRASRAGVVIRGGGVLENLGRATTLVMDKTGTMTMGRPVVVDVLTAPGDDATSILRLAASADQLSPHVLAESIVTEALRRGLRLSLPSEVVEQPGRGVAATVDGRRVAVGKLPADTMDNAWTRTVLNRARLDSAAIAWVSIENRPVGAVLLRDPLRRQAPRTVRRLREAGLNRLIMLTGDRPEPTREIAAILGLDEVCAEQTPADKFAAVRAESDRAVTVMVGDGVNDAPALAAATVGVAMGARGATASSEAADVVLTTDRIDRLADAMDIARRSRHIAVQSAVIGMALSLIAMVIATLGWLPPAPGALLQEGIDVAVILNALRALRGNPGAEALLAANTEQMLHRFAAEHEELRDTVGLLRDSADRLAADPDAAGLESLTAAHALLVDRILPHEQAEECELYPALARPLGSEATATMSRTHAEIQRLSDRIGTHLTLAQAAGAIQPDQVDDLLACLYGLYTLLRLHFVQEEENYFVLVEDDLGPAQKDYRATVSGEAT